MHGLYALVLLLSLVCLGLIDRRYRLIWYADWRRALSIFLVSVVFFSALDIAGIRQGIFFTGSTDVLLGWQVVRNFPVEELLFLLVLTYTPLLLAEYLRRRS